MKGVSAHRGAVFHFRDHCTLDNTAEAHEYFDDGLLVVEDGKVRAAGPASVLLKTLPPDVTPVNHGDRLIMPGFIDGHCHAPQTGVIAAYGQELLEWLQGYIFPEEAKFADPAYARLGNAFFLDELLRNGTTTALVYASSLKPAADDLFEQAHARNMRLIAGKTMMDQGAAGEVLDTPGAAYEDSKELIEKWHGKGRLSYAVTPRFLPTCSREEMAMVGRLVSEHPGVYVQTHLSENVHEVELVRTMYPESLDYLDAYDRFGILGPRSVFGHCIHMSDREFTRMAETGSVACWCPTSNFFLGSGIFDYARARRLETMIALGTDVSAGTSFSMLQTLAEAYKGAAVRAEIKLSPFDGLYLITLGNARSLKLDHVLGNFAPGKEADFLVLDPGRTPLMRYRMDRSRSLLDRLFVLLMLGDDRVVARTYVAGELAMGK